MNQRFPKSARLLNTREFSRVHESPHYAADAMLVVKGIQNGTEQTRLGLSVSRKVGNAVVRNRWKRTIREAFRRQRNQLPKGLDLVVRPKRGAICSHAGVFRSLRGLTEKVNRRIEKSSDPSAKDR